MFVCNITEFCLYIEYNNSIEDVACLECRGEFSSEENKKKILDLFDTYCDVQEVLAEEGLKSSI